MANGVAAQFDLIEVFGYIIPGTTLLAGFVAPLHVAIPTEFPTIAGLTLLAIAAFLVGMVIPVTLGRVHRYAQKAYYSLRGRPDPIGPAHGPSGMFVRDMWAAAQRQTGRNVNTEGRAGTELSTGSPFFDDQVWTLCQECFSLPTDFTEYYYLWRVLRAYLGTTMYTDSQRMQAMYEFCLRTWTASVFLVGYYVVLLGIQFVGLPQTITRPTSVVIGLLAIAVLFVIAFRRMALIFAETWVFHTKMDFYLDQTMER